MRYPSLPDATSLETIIEQHVRISEAVAHHSAADADAAMRHHLSEILTSLPKLAASYPEFFAA